MPKVKCPQCATVVEYVAGYDPICPTCGFRGGTPAPTAVPAALNRPLPRALPMQLSPAAREVLGTVAACTWSGPHRAQPLRRWTRLTPVAFDRALGELAAHGVVRRADGDLFWLTERAEVAARTLFD